MSPELHKTLCEKFPLIFVDRNSAMSITAMCWGFDVEDGWYPLIDVLCAKACMAPLARLIDHVDRFELRGVAQASQPLPAHRFGRPKRLSTAQPVNRGPRKPVSVTKIGHTSLGNTCAKRRRNSS